MRERVEFGEGGFEGDGFGLALSRRESAAKASVLGHRAPSPVGVAAFPKPAAGQVLLALGTLAVPGLYI